MGYLGLVMAAAVMTVAVTAAGALAAVVLAVRAGTRAVRIAELVIVVGAGQRVAVFAEVHVETVAGIIFNSAPDIVVINLGPATGVFVAGAAGFGIDTVVTFFNRQTGYGFVRTIVVGLYRCPAPIVDKRKGGIFLAGGQSHGQRDKHRQD